MARKQSHSTRNHSPFSRISRFIRSSPPSPLAREPEADPAAEDEDWYIPYRGPHEQPRGMPENADRDSWGQFVSGWLTEGPREGGGDDRYAPTSRDRAKSDAAVLASSSRNREATSRNRAFSTSRNTSRPAVHSFIHLDHAGGIGESPVTVREQPEAQPKNETARHSLASILTLGARRGLTIRHSTSTGQLPRKTSSDTERHPPPPPRQNEPGSMFLRRHPYAFPFFVGNSTPSRVPSPATPPARHVPSKLRVVPPQPSRTLPPPTLLQPTPRNRRNIRGSISTPNLRLPQTTSQSRSANVPKGRQRWLSPETWCDALILPRPRFAIRVDPGGGSGRIVSPPGSPVPPNTVTYYQSRMVQEPATGTSTAPETCDTGDSREPMLRAQSARPVAGPSRITTEEQREEGVFRSSGAERAAGTSAAPSSYKPPRPKSFALDDLALPSPVPSLTKVLEEGRQLEADRQAWQSQAKRSFQNKRARSVSRARAKTLSPANRPVRDTRTSAMEVLAERTLLGNQVRPPTVHVRLRESQSQGFRSTEEHGTGTSTNNGFGVSTISTHTHPQGRARSHAHSNSAGTGTSSYGRTEESFMWGGGTSPGHTRSRSLGKSALRLAKNTASTAAGFCGFSSAERMSEANREKVGTHADEKADVSDMLEGALRRQDTRVIRLQDQVGRDLNPDNVVLITPTSLLQPGVVHAGPVGPGRVDGVSPAPSKSSSSDSPVGIAISTPMSSDDHKHYGGRERLRLPAHPYAQGAHYAFRAVSQNPEPPAAHVLASAQETLTDGSVRHRQPVLVHPYAPFAQSNHPYAAAEPIHPFVTVDAPADDDDAQDIEAPPSTTSMYAEITPGHIREFQPEQLRYSPNILVHPVGRRTARSGPSDSAAPVSPVSHPYGPQQKRMSEWGFADALTQTLRDRGSVDSGLGTSESLEHVDRTTAERTDPLVACPTLDVLLQMSPAEATERLRPSMGREATRSSSNHTLASSPTEFVNPPSFRQSAMTANGQSSSASPGVLSHESSPPHSPRSLNVNAGDDLERFRDLFYQPPPRAESPMEVIRRPLPSRQPSSSISTRSVSGLTTLARQLAEDLDELRQHSRGDSMDSDIPSPMWGRRFGGLRGQRPDDASPDPNIVLSGPSSEASTPPEASSPPLRFPIDQHTSLTQPTINVPEDVEESSRASSVLEYSPQEESDTEHVRMGNIEALSTPAALASLRRSSTRLSNIHFLRDTDTRPNEDEAMGRVNSAYSSLGAPVSDAGRSSYMTSGTGLSRMSGLSDFPIPPTDMTPEQLSVFNSYPDGPSLCSRQENGSNSPAARPTGYLIRDPSTTTFGGQTEIGQAI